jgi:hypothetical protein
MGSGHLIPYKKGEGAKQSCPRCDGEGICPSWSGNGIPPICELCGGIGKASKAIIQKWKDLFGWVK